MAMGGEGGRNVCDIELVAKFSIPKSIILLPYLVFGFTQIPAWFEWNIIVYNC